MIRSAHFAFIAALALSAPAAAMPNAFWIFGFDGPVRGKPDLKGIAAHPAATPIVAQVDPCADKAACAQPLTPAGDPAIVSARLQLPFDVIALTAPVLPKAP